MSEEDQSVATTFLGKKNIYTCEVCFGHVVTVDADEGVTPFMIQCQATEGCKGIMHSSMYRVFDQSMRPDLVWFKPSKEDLIKLDANTREHVAKGGLIYRKYEPKPSDVLLQRRLKERMLTEKLRAAEERLKPKTVLHMPEKNK